MPFTEVNGIPIWGQPQDNAVAQILNCQKTADYCALMADHHLGYAVPIGGVVAYEGQVSPSNPCKQTEGFYLQGLYTL